MRLLRAALLPVLARYVRSGEDVRRRARASGTERKRLCFLLLDAYSQGGTARTVLNAVRELTAAYEIEVVSLRRDVQDPAFPFPAGVGVRALDDRRGRGSLLQRGLSRLPSLLWHEVEQAYPRVSLWLDLQLVRMLRSVDADVVVGTRHGLTLLLAALAPDEERDYAPALQGSRTRLVRIPNAVTPLGLLVPPADVEALAEALLTLTGDDDLRSSVARAAREKADRYDSAHIAARWKQLYDELLQDRATGVLPSPPPPAVTPAGRPSYGPRAGRRRAARHRAGSP